MIKKVKLRVRKTYTLEIFFITDSSLNTFCSGWSGYLIINMDKNKYEKIMRDKFNAKRKPNKMYFKNTKDLNKAKQWLEKQLTMVKLQKGNWGRTRDYFGNKN
jgi:hypothetical protein